MAGEKPSPGTESPTTSKGTTLDKVFVRVSDSVLAVLNLSKRRVEEIKLQPAFKAGKEVDTMFSPPRVLIFMDESTPPKEVGRRAAVTRIRVADLLGDLHLVAAFNGDTPVELPNAVRHHDVPPLDDESTKMFVTSNTPPPLNKTKETVSDKPTPNVGPTDATVGAEAALAKIAMANRTPAPAKKEEEKKKDAFVVTPEVEQAIYDLIDIEARRQQAELDKKFPGKGMKGWARAIQEKLDEQLSAATREKNPTDGIIIKMIEQYRANSKTAPVLDGFFARVRKQESELGPPKKIALAAKYAEHIHDEEERMKDEALGAGTLSITLDRVLARMNHTSPAVRAMALKQLPIVAAQELRSYVKNYNPKNAESLSKAFATAAKMKEFETLNDAERDALTAKSLQVDRKIRNMADGSLHPYTPMPNAEVAARRNKIK